MALSSDASKFCCSTALPECLSLRASQRDIGSCKRNSPEAPKINQGTSVPKSLSPPQSISFAPTKPPMIDGIANSLSVLSIDGSSALNPYAPAMDPGTSEMVLVALATTGGIPAPNKVGNVINVPPPATAFIAPATKLAAAKNA